MLSIRSKTVLLLMLSSTIFFAVGNTIVKYLSIYSVFQLVFFRSIISLSITFVQLKQRKLPVLGNNKKILLLRGISGTIALIVFFILLQNVKFGTAVTLQYLSPIFTAIIGVWMLKEKVNKWQWLSLIICFSGIVFLQKGDIYLDSYYVFLGLLTAGLSGLAYNCVRLSRKTDDPLLSVFYFPLVAVPVTLILSIPDWITPVSWDLLLILGLGIVTQIAQITMSRALQMQNISDVTIYQYLGSIYAVIIGVFVFDESPTWNMLLGIASILLGLILFFKLKPKEKLIHSKH